jgi:hypothetical protein
MQNLCLDSSARQDLTAHNLQKRGWTHHEHCVLCNGPLETGLHLCLCCPFAKAVWNQVISWDNLPELWSQPQADPVHIKVWWEESARKMPTSEFRTKTAQLDGDLHLLEHLEGV